MVLMSMTGSGHIINWRKKPEIDLNSNVGSIFWGTLRNWLRSMVMKEDRSFNNLKCRKFSNTIFLKCEINCFNLSPIPMLMERTTGRKELFGLMSFIGKFPEVRNQK